MHVLKQYPLIPALLFLTACVTINVYFPAAAAESAADRIIEEVYGDDSAEKPDITGAEKRSGTDQSPTDIVAALFNFLIPAAQAQQPDINVSTPGINKLKALMTQRHQALSAYYSSGAVGMESDGMISVRDAAAIPLKERNRVKKLVVDENRDRSDLYREIAQANGHPEWESDIRKTFARRWIANAPSGWFYRDPSGNWVRK